MQQKTLTNWVNDKLRGSGFYVQDIAADFADGVTMIKLLQSLAASGHNMPRYSLQLYIIIKGHFRDVNESLVANLPQRLS